jgi:hypothetical protein
MNRLACANNTLTPPRQRIVVIAAARSLEAAKKRFSELEGIRDPHHHASIVVAGLLEAGGAAASGQQTHQEGGAVARVGKERSGR